MELVSVNIGKAQPIAAKSGASGIYKRPTTIPVPVTAQGLQYDTIVDTENHGGVDQAVYVYTVEDYAWWVESLGRALAPGTFGENLTVSGAASAGWLVGDTLRIGSVLLQVTSPRIPCVTLATRMEDPHFVKHFVQAERPGVYCRVLQAGEVCVGDRVLHTGYAGESVSVMEMFRFDLARQKSTADLQRLLRVPLAIRARDYYIALLHERGEEPL
jgi:MOSC domain-containing protein YiiM